MIPSAQVLLVFGRGVVPDGDRFALTAASADRVRAAVAYAERHGAERVVFTGGWAEASEGRPAPPAGSREADLMAALASEYGLGKGVDVAIESRSRSTLENLLHVTQDGLLDGRDFDDTYPLGLVSHSWHLPRVRHLAGKVLGLRGRALIDIPVTSGDIAAGGLPPAVLDWAARLGFLGARDPVRLHRRERVMVAAMRWAERLRRRSA